MIQKINIRKAKIKLSVSSDLELTHAMVRHSILNAKERH